MDMEWKAQLQQPIWPSTVTASIVCKMHHQILLWGVMFVFKKNNFMMNHQILFVISAQPPSPNQHLLASYQALCWRGLDERCGRNTIYRSMEHPPHHTLDSHSWGCMHLLRKKRHSGCLFKMLLQQGSLWNNKHTTIVIYQLLQKQWWLSPSIF